MSIFTQVLMASFFAFLAWRLFKQLKSNPQLFTKVALQQSFWTMGLLGLGLVGFVTFMIVMLRN